jgi:hypothetical protein
VATKSQKESKQMTLKEKQDLVRVLQSLHMSAIKGSYDFDFDASIRNFLKLKKKKMKKNHDNP